jgi:putative addiction module component (TIGR02574 family)
MSASIAYQQLRALQLPPEEWVDFAHDLFDSVVPESECTPAAVEAGLAEETERRVVELDSGLAETTPVAQVFARARERIRQVAGIHASNFTAQERVDLATELLESVEPEEAGWANEIKSRVDEIRAGTAETYDAEEVLAELRARYG